MSRVINPDDYLETPEGRVFNAERNRQAWEQAYAALEQLLAQACTLYLVMGVQGAGKSSWIARHIGELESDALFFDAALPARQHRQRLLALAQAKGVPVIAVFVQASLEQALARNALRTPDKVVPEVALRSVFTMLEPPSVEEGFASVVLVAAQA
ncbi:MAG: AAA family ATPase [Ectopseudomonas guguanensis]|uniref:AAA family ATPase n=1 Tax=Ectopseudomonas guguanensis TaxID=1198456 RepID=UPI0039196BE6